MSVSVQPCVSRSVHVAQQNRAPFEATISNVDLSRSSAAGKGSECAIGQDYDSLIEALQTGLSYNESAFG